MVHCSAINHPQGNHRWFFELERVETLAASSMHQHHVLDIQCTLGMLICFLVEQ